MSRSKNGRSKSKKEIEPSANVTATFPYDRDKSVKDSNVIASVTAARSPGVPLQQNNLDVSTQDSLQLDYHSTLCTQPQDGGVEVTWDWHSPGRNAIGANRNNIKTCEAPSGSTPKRSTIVHKKRISNSPLMYKPLKRKLIKQENTDDIDKFKAELIALSEKIKNAREDENFSVETLDGIAKDEISGETKLKDLYADGSIRNGDRIHEPLAGDREEEENQFQELFDDSLNDTMIKCSQEIEERLNIAPVKVKRRDDKDTPGNQEGNNFLVRNKSYCRSMNMNAKSSNGNSSMIKQDENVQTAKLSSNNAHKFTMKKHKSDVAISKTRLQIPPHSTSSSTAKISSNIMPYTRQQPSDSRNGESQSNLENSDDLDIPDDSFDEFLATCDEDFSHSDINFTSTSTIRYDRICDSGHSESPTRSIGSLSPVLSKSSSTPVRNSSNISKGNVLKTNVIPNSNVGNSNVQPNMSTIPSSNAKRDWKFFKSKSHSDSGFASDNSKTANSSNKLPNQTSLTRVVSGSSVSTIQRIPSMHRTASYLDSNAMSGKSTQKINAYNIRMCHVNRCAVKEDGDGANISKLNPRDVASSIQSLQLCGPEEIARKRMEAKMKLEAKKKREKMRNNSISGSSSVVVSQNKR